jgi:hypothetical protein
MAIFQSSRIYTERMRTVMTVLEARVPQERWAELEQTYKRRLVPNVPPEMVRSLLVQSADDPERWQGISFWRSREDLEEYRRSVDTPGGVLLFRSVGAEPSLTIYEVAHEVAGPETAT